MIFHFLTKNKPPCLSVTKACSVFKLSRSGFFKYLQSADKPCLVNQQGYCKPFTCIKACMVL